MVWCIGGVITEEGNILNSSVFSDVCICVPHLTSTGWWSSNGWTLRGAVNLRVVIKKYWRQRFVYRVNQCELYPEKHGKSLKNFNQVSGGCLDQRNVSQILLLVNTFIIFSISPIVNLFNVVYINLLFFYKHMPKGNSLSALLATIFKIIYNH